MQDKRNQPRGFPGSRIIPALQWLGSVSWDGMNAVEPDSNPGWLALQPAFVTDPRWQWRFVHRLYELLLIGLCTFFTGGRTFVNMTHLAPARESWPSVGCCRQGERSGFAGRANRWLNLTSDYFASVPPGGFTSTSVTPPRRRSLLGGAVLCTEMART